MAGAEQPQRPLDPRGGEFAERFASFLRERGLLDDLSVRRALRAQQQSGERFDVVLMGLGLITDVAMAAALAQFFELRFVAADELPAEPLAVEGLDLRFLQSATMVPVREDGESLVLAVADPFNDAAVQSVAYLVGRPVHIEVAAQGDIKRYLERLESGAGGQAPASGEVAGADQASDDDIRRLEDLASEAPVIRRVQDLIARAVELQASDIHIEPLEDCLRVRIRIDGELSVNETLPKSLNTAIGSRIKIMAHLNIAERRLPQDGRVKVNVRGREIDLRVSSMPTLWGESIVLRILDRSSVELDFAKLGFAGRPFDDLSRMLAQPNGIILVTGPTGSGKTTTLYTALKALNVPSRKILTVEDPVEYQLTGINQVQVQPKIGLTFAAALRSILRQDPDIIMIGEIRDLETAHIAIQAALTGHLVLSTVHTNSAAATLTRLMDMGVERYLLASTLKAVVAQRLVRRLCPSCRTPSPDTPRVLDLLRATGLDPATCGEGTSPQVYAAHGCPACRGTGYAGRTTIYEVMTVGDELREAIAAGGSETAFERTLAGEGMQTLLQTGLVKALAGETTAAEVMRVTRLEASLDVPPAAGAESAT